MVKKSLRQFLSKMKIFIFIYIYHIMNVCEVMSTILFLSFRSFIYGILFTFILFFCSCSFGDRIFIYFLLFVIFNRRNYFIKYLIPWCNYSEQDNNITTNYLVWKCNSLYLLIVVYSGLIISKLLSFRYALHLIIHLKVQVRKIYKQRQVAYCHGWHFICQINDCCPDLTLHKFRLIFTVNIIENLKYISAIML